VDEPLREWRDIALDAALQDLRLLKEFSASKYGEVRCPVLAARGEADPVTSTSEICEWAGVTISWCAHKVFPGGHSDLLRSPEFASWLSEVRGRDAGFPSKEAVRDVRDNRITGESRHQMGDRYSTDAGVESMRMAATEYGEDAFGLDPSRPAD
jgi:hypothetical protein